jgi:hypothetical protein
MIARSYQTGEYSDAAVAIRVRTRKPGSGLRERDQKISFNAN